MLETPRPHRPVQRRAPRPRATLVVVLVLVLAAVAFETGRHSVHHLGNSHDLATCWMASAAGHVPVLTTPVPVVDIGVGLVGHIVSESRPPAAPARALEAPDVRAPPARRSA